ncbi:uncharacterized protein LOC133249960 [Bos javanicus]|uniref:uncharacterized protein LOC133249960 n=1 Tax=Bos javanicus TaxID=9906 RepID=UPI002AA68F62|nr:uncharacterized protein LOC133249960 [Bos javanicus]
MLAGACKTRPQLPQADPSSAPRPDCQTAGHGQRGLERGQASTGLQGFPPQPVLCAQLLPRLPPERGAQTAHLHHIWSGFTLLPHGAHPGARRHRELGPRQPARVGEPGHALAGAGEGAGVKPDRRTGCAEVRQGEPVVRRKLAWWARDRAPGTTGHQAETGNSVIHSRSLGLGTPRPGAGVQVGGRPPLTPHECISHVGGKAWSCN